MKYNAKKRPCLLLLTQPQVLVLAVVMVGIGSVTPALGLQHKVVSVDHFVELVAAGHLFREYGL